MTDIGERPSSPDSFSPREASDILDHVKLLLAPTLPGCTLRRFDYPIFDGWSPIELSFAENGPLPPKLVLSPDGYYCVVMLFFGYSLFLRDEMKVGFEFGGPEVHAWERLDSGPEVIAAAVQKRLADFDLAAAIAAGTVERMWTDQPRDYNLTRRLDLSLCGIYLGEDKEAQNLLRDCLRDAAEGDDDLRYVRFGAKCETYLAKLTADPDALRRELLATMDNNWSHFKVVDTTPGVRP